MEKIKNYVNRFLKSSKRDSRYDIYFDEVFSCIQTYAENPVGTICTVFDYGYAKGYRVAKAEMKKGGATV